MSNTPMPNVTLLVSETHVRLLYIPSPYLLEEEGY